MYNVNTSEIVLAYLLWEVWNNPSFQFYCEQCGLETTILEIRIELAINSSGMLGSQCEWGCGFARELQLFKFFLNFVTYIHGQKIFIHVDPPVLILLNLAFIFSGLRRFSKKSLILPVGFCKEWLKVAGTNFSLRFEISWQRIFRDIGICMYKIFSSALSLVPIFLKPNTLVQHYQE